MSGWGLYFLFLVPPLIIGFVVQHWLKKTVAANMQVPVANGLSGADVARQILDRNGLHDVPVETSPGGPLSDHYDPRHKSVHLSEPVYGGRSVASTAIAAHEVGHAIQHAKAYAPFRARSALWPVVAFASNAWFFLLLIGVFAQVLGLIQLAIVLFAVVVLFQLVTLPVEFDASRRALAQVNDLGLVVPSESQGARKVLTAAAMTYVAAALARALAARVLRADLPRQPELVPAMRVIALIVRAGAVAVAAGFLFSLVIDGTDPPATVAAQGASAAVGTTSRRRSRSRRGRRPRSRRSRPASSPSPRPATSSWARRRTSPRRRPVVLLRRRGGPRRRRRARQPRGDALDRRKLEVRSREHELPRVPDAAVVRGAGSSARASP